jgi:hypothetical protein
LPQEMWGPRASEVKNLSPKPAACQNPDESCPAAPVVRWHRPILHLCKRCYERFRTHGDGRKLAPWGTRFEKEK